MTNGVYLFILFAYLLVSLNFNNASVFCTFIATYASVQPHYVILRTLEWDWVEWFIENSEGVSYCALVWLVKLKKSCRESGLEIRMCPHEWEELEHSTVCLKKTICVVLAFICFIVQKSLRVFGFDSWDHFNQPYWLYWPYTGWGVEGSGWSPSPEFHQTH